MVEFVLQLFFGQNNSDAKSNPRETIHAVSHHLVLVSGPICYIHEMFGIKIFDFLSTCIVQVENVSNDEKILDFNLPRSPHSLRSFKMSDEAPRRAVRDHLFLTRWAAATRYTYELAIGHFDASLTLMSRHVSFADHKGVSLQF